MSNERALVVHPTSHDRRVEEAHARLHRARLHTRATLTNIREEVAEKVDLKRMVRARPGLFLGLAFFTGFLLAHRR